MIKNPIDIIRTFPNASMLILIAVSGAVADFLYPIYSNMGLITLSISPGEIVRGTAFIVLLIMLINGKLALPRNVFFAFMIFSLVSIAYAYLGEEQILSRQEMRIFVFIKILYLVLMAALVLRVIQHNELTIQGLINVLTMWSLVFFITPIILSYYGIIGYSGLETRIQHQGLVFSINASSVVLLATYPLMAIPSTISGIVTSLTGFTACEMIGTKAAAVGGLIIPLILMWFALYHKINFYIKTTGFIIITFIIVFIFKDVIWGVQVTNLEVYKEVYYQSQDFLMTITSGRSDYYYQLPLFIEQNNWIELLVGSPIMCFNEMDHLMILSRFGIIGVIFYFIIVWQAVIIAMRLMKRGWLQSQIALSIFALIAHSTFGGHVIAGTVSSFPVAAIIAMAVFFSSDKTTTVNKS